MTLIIASSSATHEVIVESLIVVLSVTVHPNLSQAYRVFLHDVYPCAPLVRAALAKNMADVRTDDNFEDATTHPDLKPQRNI